MHTGKERATPQIEVNEEQVLRALVQLSPTARCAELAKLTANRRSVIEDTTVTAQEREDAKSGQQRLL